jgi:hypothetical protein
VLKRVPEQAVFGMDQKAPAQGLDGVPFPSRDVERSREVQVEEARPATIANDRSFAEGDAAISLSGESEQQPAIREVSGVLTSRAHEPGERLARGAERSATVVAHGLLEENLVLDHVHGDLDFPGSPIGYALLSTPSTPLDTRSGIGYL